MSQTPSVASNSKRRFRRRAILLGLLLSILGASWTFRQSALDRELIDAIKAQDTKVALDCLDSGANPNTHDPYEDEEKNRRIDGFGDILECLKQAIENRPFQFHDPALIVLFVDRIDPYQTKLENLEIARALLEHGANINARDADGATPLMWALHLKWNQTAQLLLDRGADIQLRGRDGTTMLMAAQGELTEKLIQRGADVHAVDAAGWTPLHHVCEAADLPAIQSLIAHGADVNAISQDNSTPLLLVARSRRPDSLEAMKLLLAHGANIQAKTSGGRTVLMRSALSGDVEKVNSS